MRGRSQSGAHLCFDELLVYKRASGSAGKRLLEQCRKMRAWPPTIPGVHVPRVRVSWSDADLVELTIDRVQGPGLAIACPRWEVHMRKVVSLVHHLVGSGVEGADTGFAEKRRQVAAAVCAVHGIKELPGLCALPEAPLVPIGLCHGDLSLSNVLCGCARGHGDIELIDMIEGHVSSPVLDVAKLRQDTAHGWLLRLDSSGAMQERLRVADALIIREFSQYPWYAKSYSAYQRLNLARILPYLPRGHRDVLYIVDEMERIDPWEPSY